MAHIAKIYTLIMGGLSKMSDFLTGVYRTRKKYINIFWNLKKWSTEKSLTSKIEIVYFL